MVVFNACESSLVKLSMNLLLSTWSRLCSCFTQKSSGSVLQYLILWKNSMKRQKTFIKKTRWFSCELKACNVYCYCTPQAWGRQATVLVQFVGVDMSSTVLVRSCTSNFTVIPVSLDKVSYCPTKRFVHQK